MGTKLIHTCTVAASLSALVCGCASTTTTRPGAKTSFTESITNSVKSGANKVTAALTPKPTPPDETSGFRDPKPTPSLHVAIAQLSERNGNLEDAEKHYRKALDLDSGYLPALLGFAHLEDGRKNFDAADKLYHRAVKKHPKDAAAHNDLGLCYHRQGKLKEATRALETAVELQPSRHLYRDNLAAVLVDQGRNEEALRQLCAAHGDAVGHYNLAYLLAQRPDPRQSLPYFQMALEKDPTLDPAREWIAQLAPMPPQHHPMLPPPAQQPLGPPPQTWAPRTQPPVMIARQPPPAAQAAIPPSEPLPSTTVPPPAAPAVAAPVTREPATVARAQQPPQEQPAPAVETLRSEGVIRATVGEGAGAASASGSPGDVQFVPTPSR